MPYLRLLRLPALFTTFPDVLAGYAIVRQGAIEPLELILLLLASGCLYLSGMVFNDVFDVAQDTEERPNRPIPAGEISRGRAATLGGTLMLTGVVVGSFVSMVSGIVAVALAVSILLYDAGGKRTIFGPLLMGFCRAWNLLLGASVSLFAAEGGVSQVPLLMAVLIGVYVTGITLFARSEARLSTPWPLRFGVALIFLALIGWGMAASSFSPGPAMRFVVLMLFLIAFQLARRVMPALRTGEPKYVQNGVRVMLLTIPMLEAIAIVAHGGEQAVPLAIAAALMMIPGQILSRFIPMT